MSLFGKSKKVKSQISIADCLKSKSYDFTSFPVEINENGEFNTNSIPAFSLKSGKNGAATIAPEAGFEGKAFLNSAPLNEAKELLASNTFQYGSHIYIIFSGEKAGADARRVDFGKWLIFNTESGMVEDEVEFSKIQAAAAKRGLTGKGLAICPKGTNIGFFFDQIFTSKTDPSTCLELSEGSVTCPMCWLKFDIGDAFNIASHESLRGDPILGSEEMMRFLPTSFDNDGIALDPANMPSHDLACPHCRKRLPPAYLDLNRHIISIVGAPSSGKSYYLSVLINELQAALFKHYGVSFKDLDPTGNILLTQMKNRLFSAENPEDAILAKTALEGAMYERYPRFGKMVALPKPMTYSISRANDNSEKKESSAMIFYDNAGEHFEPGLDIEDSPGAMHVASSSALFFLFDPASNRYFKKLLKDNADPQLKISGRIDQQDTILAEMEIRIKRILGLSSVSKVHTPLAMVLGKYDLWKDLLPKPLEPYYENGKLSIKAVNRNSALLRDFMVEIDPSIVAGAESISYEVRYFAVSPLGHSPIKLEEGPAAGKIAPVPSLLNPMNVEIPTLWALSILEPNLISS